MPKEITHWILAQQVLERLDQGSRIAGIIRANYSAYMGGTVLPDTLLHIFRGPHSTEALHLAHRFHDATGNSFAPLIEAEAGHGDGLPHNMFACLLGVISHMLTDSVFHPYVFAQSGVRNMGLHYRLETAIDVYFLHLCKATPAPVRRVDQLITPETRQTLLDAAALLFDPDGKLPAAVLEQALELHCRIQSMYDRTWWKIIANILASLPRSPFKNQRHLFYPLRASGLDHMKMIHAIGQWKHPVSGAVTTTSLDNLADETIKQTLAVFKCIDEEGSLTGALSDPPGANLLTGLHAVGISEMKREEKKGSRHED